jgi:outer membrane protein assembly factor BamB
VWTLFGATAVAQDWPQWLGPGRNATASLDAPEEWPETLAQGWKVEVGNGVATPALAGDRLFVFTREGGEEVVRCLDAASGDEIWSDRYESAQIQGPAGGFPGPRSSPAVADGKVVTLGATGILSCYEADSGEMLWRNTDNVGQESVPRFFTSSSPLLADGMSITQFGSEQQGGVVAHDLATGDEKWTWSEGTTTYGSLNLMEANGRRILLAPTSSNLVMLDVATGEKLGEMELAQGRYNAGTPMVYDNTVVVGGPNRGMTAVRVELDGDSITTEPVWRNEDEVTNTQYNSPIVKDGFVYGVSANNVLFCINTETSEVTWQTPLADAAAGGAGQGRGGDRGPGDRPPQGGDRKGGDRQGGQPGGDAKQGDDRAQRPGGDQQGDRQEGQRPRRRGMRGGGGRGGYGSIVDAGTVLISLTPAGELRVFSPNGEEYTELARYKVAESGTYAYPVVAGNRIFVKDDNSLTMYTIGAQE